MSKFRIAGLAVLAGLMLGVQAKAETYVFMVGISDYPDVVDKDGNRIKDEAGNFVDMDLSGCVNDIKSYQDLLVNKYGVKPENIKVALDKDATKQGFLDGVKWMYQSAKAGDQIVFAYSGHGGQINDTTEEDGKEEVICLVDDSLVPGDFFNDLANAASSAGINGTYLFDSCYSGGMSRDVFSFDGKPGTSKRKFAVGQAIARMKRVAQPELDVIEASVKSKAKADKGSYAFVFGGQENQTTTDLDFKDPAQADHGLFTLMLSGLIDKFPEAPIEEIMAAISQVLKEKGFEQKPHFEFSSPDRGKQPLILK